MPDRPLEIATCAKCGAPKFVKNPCPACAGKKNVPGSTRTLKAR